MAVRVPNDCAEESVDLRTPTAPPGVFGMAASFAGAMARFASSAFRTVPGPQLRLRVEQCGRCEHLVESRCRLCGYFVGLKARLPAERCPVGRWAA